MEATHVITPMHAIHSKATNVAVLAGVPLAVTVAAIVKAPTLAATPGLLWLFLGFMSPLMPFGLHAYFTGDVRDCAMRNLARPLRAVAMIPWLATSRRSPVRAETWASLAGCAAAGMVIAGFAG